jgi:hypothetical protein
VERSEQLNELAAALAKAQGAMQGAAMDRANPFFKSKYATLNSIWDAIRKPLADNGLAVVQTPDQVDGDVILRTLLVHASGQWIVSDLRMRPAKADPQGIGSALSYARRYALAAMVGATSDEDDDGNGATQPQAQPQKAQPQARPAAAPAESSTDSDKDFESLGAMGPAAPDKTGPSNAQLARIHIIAKKLYPDNEAIAGYRKWMKATYGVESSKDLTEATASDLIGRLEATERERAQPL